MITGKNDITGVTDGGGCDSDVSADGFKCVAAQLVVVGQGTSLLGFIDSQVFA
ncbi:hypothetical protein QW180_29580 [Vibrio sinaloensis]|nr:hypothetical protein [Vibrio sinaloensis]